MSRSSASQIYTLALYDPLDHRQKPKEIDREFIPEDFEDKVSMCREYNEAVLEHDDLFSLLGIFLRTQVKRSRTKQR